MLNELINELNEEQKIAVLNPINTCTKIVAGAGTGKTKIISKRYVKLVNDLLDKNVENPLETILVITFTEKAAIEMKERIFRELKLNNINYFNQEDEISTIHGFCSKFLRKHSIEANLSPSFSLTDETQYNEIYSNIINKIKQGEYFTFENIEKIEQELEIEKDLLKIDNLCELTNITKLDTLFEDILPIIKKVKSLGLSPKEFLDNSITAIQKYSKTLETIPFKFKTEDEYLIAWKNHMKNYYEKNCDFQNAFKKLCGDKIIIRKNGQRKAECWGQAENFPEIIKEITSIEIYLTKVISYIYAIFQDILEQNDLIDFDDLINKTIQVLKNNDDIRKFYQNQFKHIIIDEFQDTNGAQLKLIELLLSDEAPNITMVGDKKQSIYGFRFARMENLDILQKIIEKKYNKKYEEIKLKTNYRSIPKVLEVVNYITENQLLLDEKITANNKETINDAIKFSVFNFNNQDELKIDEAKYIAQEIIKYKNEKGLKYRDFAVLLKTNYQSDIIYNELLKLGIPSIKKINTSFFEKNVIRNVIAILNFLQNIHNEINFIKILRINFSDKEIYDLKKDIEISLKNMDLKRYSFSEKVNYLISNNLMIQKYSNHRILDFITDLFNIIIQINNNKKSLSITNMFDKLINTIPPYQNLSGLLKQIADMDLLIFRKIIFDYEKNEVFSSLKNFNEYIERIKNDKNFELPSIISDDFDAVNLLTIHSSKGLEFPYVFIFSISNKDMPDTSSITYEMNFEENILFGLIIKNFGNNPNPKYAFYRNFLKNKKEYDEKLRLFYVATSRAQKYLNILTFNPQTRTKPADYIEDLLNAFPENIVNIDDINPEKQELLFDIVQDNTGEEIPKEIPKIEDISPKQTVLSFSQINTFNFCTNKFLLKYKYNFPETTTENKGSVIGKVIHNLIYLSFLNKKIFSNQEIESYIENIELSQVEKKKIFNIYSNFEKSSYSKYLAYENLQEYGFDFIYNDVRFKGDIDLVIFNEDKTVSIIDFKTNKNIEENLNNYKKQMIIYKKALESQNFFVKKLVILNITETEIKEITIKSEETEQSENELKYDIQNILNNLNNKLSIQNTQKCQACGYNYICNK